MSIDLEFLGYKQEWSAKNPDYNLESGVIPGFFDNLQDSGGTFVNDATIYAEQENYMKRFKNMSGGDSKASQDAYTFLIDKINIYPKSGETPQEHTESIVYFAIIADALFFDTQKITGEGVNIDFVMNAWNELEEQKISMDAGNFGENWKDFMNDLGGNLVGPLLTKFGTVVENPGAASIASFGTALFSAFNKLTAPDYKESPLVNFRPIDKMVLPYFKKIMSYMKTLIGLCLEFISPETVNNLKEYCYENMLVAYLIALNHKTINVIMHDYVEKMEDEAIEKLFGEMLPAVITNKMGGGNPYFIKRYIDLGLDEEIPLEGISLVADFIINVRNLIVKGNLKDTMEEKTIDLSNSVAYTNSMTDIPEAMSDLNMEGSSICLKYSGTKNQYYPVYLANLFHDKPIAEFEINIDGFAGSGSSYVLPYWFPLLRFWYYVDLIEGSYKLAGNIDSSSLGYYTKELMELNVSTYMFCGKEIFSDKQTAGQLTQTLITNALELSIFKKANNPAIQELEKQALMNMCYYVIQDLYKGPTYDNNGKLISNPPNIIPTAIAKALSEGAYLEELSYYSNEHRKTATAGIIKNLIGAVKPGEKQYKTSFGEESNFKLIANDLLAMKSENLNMYLGCLYAWNALSKNNTVPSKDDLFGDHLESLPLYIEEADMNVFSGTLVDSADKAGMEKVESDWLANGIITPNYLDSGDYNLEHPTPTKVTSKAGMSGVSIALIVVAIFAIAGGTTYFMIKKKK